jgi:hypothetical protein
MRHRYIWMLGMLTALVAALDLWWPRPPKLPTLHLVSLHGNPSDPQAYSRGAVIELRNNTNALWYCTHQLGGSIMVEEKILSGETERFSMTPGNTFEVLIQKKQSRLEGWLEDALRRVSPARPAHANDGQKLHLYVPPDFVQTTPFEKLRSTEGP